MTTAGDQASATAPADGARIPVIGIGASAGGLEALREMLSVARPPTNMAFVVVQHLDPNHESMLAQLLDRATPLDVLQCEGGEALQPDRVYIIPPGRGLAIRDGRLQLTDFAQPRGLRRPIDDFFLSLAADQQANAACVILSGTGADGSTGLRAIKEHGGVCVAQLPESARYDGMPVAAVGTGLVDYVKPPSEILDCLYAFFGRRMGEDAEPEAELVADHVDDLCRVLRTAIGHDFSGYKRSTLVRRVERRMHVLSIRSGRGYLQRVRTDAAECEALFRDLLINVTRFFRDADLFEALRTRVIEPLLRDRPADEDVRVWVPGCSSGEEAYSIAMLFAEAARAAGVAVPVQIFATDIDEQMLQVAREGSYPASALADIPSPLRERYTVPHGERFAVAGEIRDLIRFSNHSLVKDPPFSRIDLVSCRNLLIYFDDRLQQAVMPILHYAIRPGGFLFLGPSESIGRFDQLFPAVDQHARIFERSPGEPTYPLDLPASERILHRRRDEGGSRGGEVRGTNLASAVQRLAERYAPPSMVLTQDGAMVAAYGRLSGYFDFPVTRAGGSSAMTLAKPGLRDVIGPLLRQTRDSRQRTVAREVEVRSEYGTQRIEVICEPLADATFLVVFRDSAAFEPARTQDFAELEAGDDHMEALEDELRLTRHKLRTAVEELETANEELKSSNEEMMSMNEELQSTNEELSTVNDELKSKVDQLTVANSDLRNFFESTELAVIVLDSDLRVRSFTEAATSIFPLQPTDRGRSLADVATKLDDAGYLDDARTVAASGAAVQRRVQTKDGRTLALRILPYHTQHRTVDGATMVLTDITEALSLERQLAAERERLEMAMRAGGIGVWEYCAETGELILDQTSRQMLGLAADDASIDALLRRIAPDDRAEVEAMLRRAAAGTGEFEATFRTLPDGGADADGDGRRIKSFGRLLGGSTPRRLVGAAIDITPEYMLAETRALMLREMNHRVKNLFAIVSGMISAGARAHGDIRTFADDLRERIAALGRAHSLSAPSGEQQATPLRTLLDATLAPYRGAAAITLDGPDLTIDRNCLSPLALIFHEWTTNAAKYGVLAGAGGALKVTWRRDADGVAIVWRETGGAPPPADTGRGFGTILVETSIRQLRGQLERGTVDGAFQMCIRLPASVFSA